MKKLFLAFALLMFVPRAEAASCLRLHDIRTWQPVGKRELLVRNDFHDLYKVTLSGTCGNLKNDLEVHSLGGEDLTCMAPGDLVSSRSFGAASQCKVARITVMVQAAPPPRPAGSRDKVAVPSPALD